MTACATGCGRPHHAHGLCNPCYRRSRRMGYSDGTIVQARRNQHCSLADDPVIAAVVHRFINDPRTLPCDHDTDDLGLIDRAGTTADQTRIKPAAEENPR